MLIENEQRSAGDNAVVVVEGCGNGALTVHPRAVFGVQILEQIVCTLTLNQDKPNHQKLDFCRPRP